jgi:hypothetical protein
MRNLLPGLTLALAGVLAAVVWRASDERALADVRAAEAARRAEPARPDATLDRVQRAEAAAERIAVEPASAGVSPASAPRDSVVVQVVGLRDPAGVSLRVVTGMDGLGWYDLDRATQRRRALGGAVYRADASGRATIPRPPGGPLLPYAVAAERGELWGFASAHAADDRVEVALDAFPGFAIRVEHANGAPARDVVLRAGATAASLQPVARTDAAGRAHLADREAHACVGVEIAGLDAEESSTQVAGKDDVVLRLPPCGSLAVRLLDERGRPFHVRDGRVDVRLAPAPAELETLGPALSGVLTRAELLEMTLHDRPVWSLPVAGDRVRFPLVALGVGFELSFSGDGLKTDEPFRIDGPRADGEEVVARLAPVESLRFLSARLVDEHGAALANAGFALRETPHGQSLASASSMRVVTDAGGRLRMQPGRSPASATPAHPAQRIDLVLASDPTRGVSLRLPRELRVGGSDLGTHALVPVPVLVEGVVLGADGAPCAGARVRYADAGANPVDLQALPGKRRTWIEPFAATDAGGRFALRGWCEPGARIVLTAARDRDEALFEPVVAAGTRGVALRLASPGSLRVDVRLDEFVPLDSVRVTWSSGGREEDVGHREQWTAAGDAGAFELIRDGVQCTAKGLLPGRYAVQVALRSSLDLLRPGSANEVLVRIDDVVVRPGTETLDARLSPLDLRGCIAVLDVATCDGNVHAGALACSVRSAGSRAPWSEPRTFAGGRVTLAAADGPIDVRIESATHRTEIVEWVRGLRSVRLRRAPPVRLEVVGADLPSGDMRLVVSLRNTQREAFSCRWDAQDTAPRGLAPGTYDVKMTLLRSDGVPCVAQISVAPTAVVVADRDEEQRFVLAPDPAALRAALDR